MCRGCERVFFYEKPLLHGGFVVSATTCLGRVCAQCRYFGCFFFFFFFFVFASLLEGMCHLRISSIIFVCFFAVKLLECYKTHFLFSTAKSTFLLCRQSPANARSVRNFF